MYNSWDFVALYDMLDGSLYIEPGVSQTDIKRYLLSLYQLLREVAKRRCSISPSVSELWC